MKLFVVLTLVLKFTLIHGDGPCAKKKVIQCISLYPYRECAIDDAQRITSISSVDYSGSTYPCKSDEYSIKFNRIRVTHPCQANFTVCYQPLLATCTKSVEIECQSKGLEKVSECFLSETMMITAVVPLQLHVHGGCIKGETYGWRKNKLMVAGGCQATFKVCYETYSCPKTTRLPCISVQNARTECAISNTARITHASVSKLYSKDTDCTVINSFGWHDNKLWVDNDCRADFDICYEDEDIELCDKTRVITCRSWSYSPKMCVVSDAKHITSATVKRELSKETNCTIDGNFGFFGNNIWVSDGCSAEFTLCYTPGSCPTETSVSLLSYRSSEHRSFPEAASLISMTYTKAYRGTFVQCKLNKSYYILYSYNAISVGDNCDAEFVVCYNPKLGTDVCTTYKQVICESQNYTYAECEIGGSVTAAMVETELPGMNGQCIIDKTFGYDGNNIWVYDGCGANFTVCYQPSNVSCTKKVTQKCESRSGENTECKISGAARVTSVKVNKVIDGQCTNGSNFGIVDDAVWVSKNCQASFDVCYEPTVLDTSNCTAFKEVLCENKDMGRTECDISGAGSIEAVAVKTQYSDYTHRCIFDKSFGFHHNLLWVHGGCRADFTVCYNTEKSENKYLCPAYKVLKCESWSLGYVECKIGQAGSIISVSVKTQHSSNTTNCTLDTNFGFYDNNIWVYGGCSADFVVCFKPGDGPCIETKTQKCESLNGEYKKCHISEAARVTSVEVSEVIGGQCTNSSYFGMIDDAVYVTRDCRANFDVCYEPPETASCTGLKEMKCENQNSSRTECKLDEVWGTIKFAVVKSQYTGVTNKCILDKTYGVAEDILWVSGGCHADFTVCYTTDFHRGRCPGFIEETIENYSLDRNQTSYPFIEKIISADIKMILSGDRDKCNIGRHIGFHDNVLWVDGGCSAVFQICYYPKLDAVRCPTSKEVTVENKKSSRLRKEIDGGAFIIAAAITKQFEGNNIKCILGENFGYNNKVLWFDSGCHAVVKVCYYPSIGQCTTRRRTERCESINSAYTKCPVAGVTKITAIAVKTRLGGFCEIGTNFGQVTNYIWVKSGCKAVFDICYEAPVGVTEDKTKEPEKIEPHKFCYIDYPILDALLCYRACRPGYAHKGGGPLCWGKCPPHTTNIGLFCTKKTYGRGWGKVLSTCSSSQHKSGALCYPKCRSGYEGVGPVCWEHCKSGYHDDGALCRRNAHIYGRDVGSCPWHDKCGLCGGPWYNICGKRRRCGRPCRSGYKNDGCTCRKNVHIYAKHTYGRGVGRPMGCKANEERNAALCYPRCRSGYYGVGPVCWASCSGQTIDTGAQCQKKAYGRGVGKVINCLKPPKMVYNSSGLQTIMEGINEKSMKSFACRKLYTDIKFWVSIGKSLNGCNRKDEWTTVSVSYGAGLAAGFEVSSEVGLAADFKLEKGICYVGYCFGMKTDVSIEAEIVFGYWRSLDDIPGESWIFELGVDIPFTEVGISVVSITNADDEYIGTQVALGVGVGILPIELGFSYCKTPEDSIVPFEM